MRLIFRYDRGTCCTSPVVGTLRFSQVGQSMPEWTKVQFTHPWCQRFKPHPHRLWTTRPTNFRSVTLMFTEEKKFYFRLLDMWTSDEGNDMARNITSYFEQTLKVSSISDKYFMGFTLGRPVKNRLSAYHMVQSPPQVPDRLTSQGRHMHHWTSRPWLPIGRRIH